MGARSFDDTYGGMYLHDVRARWAGVFWASCGGADAQPRSVRRSRRRRHAPCRRRRPGGDRQPGGGRRGGAYPGVHFRGEWGWVSGGGQRRSRGWSDDKAYSG